MSRNALSLRTTYARTRGLDRRLIHLGTVLALAMLTVGAAVASLDQPRVAIIVLPPLVAAVLLIGAKTPPRADRARPVKPQPAPLVVYPPSPNAPSDLETAFWAADAECAERSLMDLGGATPPGESGGLDLPDVQAMASSLAAWLARQDAPSMPPTSLTAYDDRGREVGRLELASTSSGLVAWLVHDPWTSDLGVAPGVIRWRDDGTNGSPSGRRTLPDLRG